jgi:methylated-DNA-[protein]-cysteine S-methyltransferase
VQLRVRGYPFEVDETVLEAEPATVRSQVEAYAGGRRREFDLGVSFPDGLLGDAMREMVAIPYGETRTYGELAAALGTAPVAVGSVCGRNPVPVVVPCHRVVGTDSLGGFSAAGGVDAKRALLRHETGQTALRRWSG